MTIALACFAVVTYGAELALERSREFDVFYKTRAMAFDSEIGCP